MLNSALAKRLSPERYKDIERQLIAIFYDILFRPVVAIVQATNPAIVQATAIQNAVNNPLEQALRAGRVQYVSGVFSGRFSALISKALSDLGARWDPRSNVYKLADAQVPPWVKVVSEGFRSAAQAAHEAIQRELDTIQRNLDIELTKKKVDAKKMVRRTEKDFAPAADALRVSPTLAPASLDRLADAYTDNMSLWIKKFSEEMIGDLRGIVEKNAQAGYRFDTLVDEIKMRYSVTQSKAEFLARQETALFSAKFRKERFGEAGVTHYRWSTSHDERVRPTPETKGVARQDNHRRLDGRIFSYADPPVVDTATGRRCNPGEDYNCRCVDIPILEPIGATA